MKMDCDENPQDRLSLVKPILAVGRVLAQPQGRPRHDGFVHGADRVASAASSQLPLQLTLIANKRHRV